jgi:AcrR family transcriptional regulator
MSTMTATLPAPTKADRTREALMDAGERLFAARGVDDVTVAEITRSAGQRNGAAIHYHFGGRDGLLEAILDRHLARIDAEHLARLDALRASGALSLRALAAVAVEPVASSLETESGRAFLKIQAHRSLAEGGVFEQPSAGMAAVRKEFAAFMPDVPTEVIEERGRLVGLMMHQRLGRRADEETRGIRRPSRRVLVQTLIDAMTAVLSAPQGAAT